MTDTMDLTEVEVLRALDEDGGWDTGDVARQAGRWRGLGPRIASRSCRCVLIRLQAAGLVAPLDNEKPVAWLRTPAGTDALARHEAGG